MPESGPQPPGQEGGPGASAWLGQLERSIIDFAKKKGGRVRPSDAARALGVDVRRVHDALRRLEARGLVRRVARGLYEVVEDPSRLAALPARDVLGAAGEGSRAGRGAGGSRLQQAQVSGPYIAWVADLSGGAKEVDVPYVVWGLGEMAGSLEIYTDPQLDGPNSVRVEWKIPADELDRRPELLEDESYYWDNIMRALEALLALSLTRGPPEHVRRVLRLARSLPQPRQGQ